MTALTNTAIRLAKAKGKAYTLPDSDGLTLAIAPEGGKSWHFRFYWMGRQKRLSFGTFPAVSLEQARALRDEARELLAQGIHPGEHRNHKREAARREEEQTFEAGGSRTGASPSRKAAKRLAVIFSVSLPRTFCPSSGNALSARSNVPTSLIFLHGSRSVRLSQLPKGSGDTSTSFTVMPW